MYSNGSFIAFIVLRLAGILYFLICNMLCLNGILAGILKHFIPVQGRKVKNCIADLICLDFVCSGM